MSDFTFEVLIAGEKHTHYAEEIANEMAESAKARGTGIAKRSPEYLQTKMREGKAIIALEKKSQKVAGFCYIEVWQDQQYAANSGLIVFPDFRKYGLATEIKEKAFELSRKKYPKAKLFGLTTSLAVMKINSDLGYKPVPFSELTTDPSFWAGCKTCTNYEILKSKENKMCLCTGMLYDPKEKQKDPPRHPFNEAVLKRLKKIKQALFLSKILSFSFLS